MIRLPSLCAALVVLAAAGAAQADSTITVTYTQVPTSTIAPDLEIRSGTVVRGLNDSGQFVGSFGERNSTTWGLPHGFIHDATSTIPPSWGTGSASRSPEGYRLGVIDGPRYADPSYRYLDLAPSSGQSEWNDRFSQPNAINNAGMVVGHMSTDAFDHGPFTAFSYDSQNRVYTALAVPGATSSEATDINNLGQIVGNFRDATGDHGFLYSGGVYTVIDMPGEVGHTRIGGISDNGSIVGSAYDIANASSFIYSNGSFSNFTANGAFTVASDVNTAGQIVGWVGVSGTRRGFVYQNGITTLLDLSTSNGSTYLYTINNAGEIGGTVEGGGTSVGFLATVTAVPEPSTALLWFIGLVSVAGLARRRQAAHKIGASTVRP